MQKHIQTDELQNLIDWQNIMPMSRYAGGHDEQMKGLFKDVEVIAHWNEDDYQGQVGTCVKFTKGKFKGKYAIYNDYYGSCSGCDAWEAARLIIGSQYKLAANVQILPMVGITCTTAHHSTKFNSSALLNGGTSAPLLAIYCWQQLIFKRCIISHLLTSV